MMPAAHPLPRSRIRTFYRARPEPGDHGELLPHIRLQIRSILHHLRRDFDFRIKVADALFRFVPHPLSVIAHILGQSLAPFHSLSRKDSYLFVASGFTGGLPANFGGISIMALLISTATGFRSLAYASSPNRWASSGSAPPPAKGS